MAPGAFHRPGPRPRALLTPPRSRRWNRNRRTPQHGRGTEPTTSTGGLPSPYAESLDEAVVRGIREETGLVIPGLVPFARTRATGPHVSEGHIQVYVGQRDDAAEALPVTEGIMFRWFDVETMEQLTMCAWAHRMILAHHRAERAALPPRNPVIVQKDQSS
ncbi:NUDIX hydrolase [Streptomyces sp. NPDC048680]|uniref:NUDIX hydrolase n=1 Tax=Streptomyces sp. NPDC048680 TaxID=3155492 RepID=UPI00343F3AF0